MKKVRLKLGENVNLALIAIGLAVVMWVFAKSGETQEARLVVPVVANTEAANNSQIEILIEPETVPVVVRYTRDAASEVSSENFSLMVDTVDLTEKMGVEWESKTITLSEHNWETNLPSSRVNPIKIGQQNSTVKVSMRWRSVAALVVPNIVGQDTLPEGLQLVTPVKVTPREVHLKGDAKILAALKTDPVTSRAIIETSPVNVANKRQTSFENVELDLPAGVTPVNSDDIYAEVTLEIHEVQTVREIRGIPIAFQAIAPDSVTLEHDAKTANLTVFGPQSLLPQLSAESFRLSLIRPDEEIPGADRDLPLDAEFAPAVSDDIRTKVVIRSIDPKTIRVKYKSRNAGATP